jgi:hypothetical protein
VVAFSTKASNLVPDDTNGRPDVVVRTWSATSPATTAVSVTTTGAVGSSSSLDPSLSRDGNMVAFTSFATDLVAGDTNGTSDVFVRDVAAAMTTLISVSHTGGPSDGGSGGAEIKTNGTSVVYDSYATNLVSSDTNNHRDVFQTGVTTLQTHLLSQDRYGIQGDADSFEPAVSGNGVVVFSSKATNLTTFTDTNGLTDVIVKVGGIGLFTLSSDAHAPVAYGGSGPAISADGDEVVFTSMSGNLAPGDTNNATDLFMPSEPGLSCEKTTSGQFECALTVTPASTTVRWYNNGAYLPALDNLTSVAMQVMCQPGVLGSVIAAVTVSDGIAGFHASYWCP